jgi:hypothetical protein
VICIFGFAGGRQKSRLIKRYTSFYETFLEFSNNTGATSKFIALPNAEIVDAVFNYLVEDKYVDCIIVFMRLEK